MKNYVTAVRMWLKQRFTDIFIVYSWDKRGTRKMTLFDTRTKCRLMNAQDVFWREKNFLAPYNKSIFLAAKLDLDLIKSFNLILVKNVTPRRFSALFFWRLASVILVGIKRV